MGAAFAGLLTGATLERRPCPTEISIKGSNYVPVYVFDTQKKRLLDIKKKAPAVTLCSLEILIQKSDLVILAVKPQDMDALLKELRTILVHVSVKGKAFISIAAGLPVSFFKQRMPVGSVVVRTMPNLGLKVGFSYTAVCFDTEVSATQKKDVQRILSMVGKVAVVKEDCIDNVTAISGSGPGYIFSFLHALQKAAVKLGFAQDEAERMVRMTIIGTAKLLEKEPLSFDVWTDRVCSKGGTTQAALEHLRENKFDKLIIEAAQKAYKRAKELNR